MDEHNSSKSLPSNELWLKVINEGIEDRVEVNQRMLIDKMLARYSSDFVVYRELIQNSDDAQATSFTLDITCDLTTVTQIDESINQRETHNTSENTRSSTKIPIEVNNNIDINPKQNNQTLSENDFNNCTITEIRTTNNGHIFNEDDWKRVITIAEGNTNVDAIGQFGVGFFSVFSYSERPLIQSGKYCLAFVWQNGKSLTTFRKELPLDQQSSTTSIILQMRNKYILQTNSIIETNEIVNEYTKQGRRQRKRRTKSKKTTATNEIVPTLDLAQLKTYFTKVLSFTKYINQLIIKINDTIVFQVNKTRKTISSTKLSFPTKRNNSNNEHNLIRLKSFLQTEQTFSIMNGPSISLNHVDVQAEVIIDKALHKQIENVLKKSLPSTIHIEFLFPSNNIFDDEQWKILNDDNLNKQILEGLIPLKIHDDEVIPSGQIFIGLATHQSTGIGMHVFSHLIPTIERENIDLQDPYISIWNEQLLASIGKIVRLIYDQTIVNAVNNTSQQLTNQQLNAILSPYAFQPSAPNKEIGRIILDGFFSSDKDILVPVKKSPSDDYLSLISSTEAFLTRSKHIQSFLPVPLVPFDIGKNDFFKTLKTYQWIDEIDNDTILVKIQESILHIDEFIGLIRWLCTNDIHNKSYIKQILSKIRYRENRQSSIIKLEKIEYFDNLNLLYLPLPPYVLPSNIASHISREDLQRRLSLSPISMKNLIEFYLEENQQYLFKNENTSCILLNFISQRWNQFNETDANKIKSILSNIKCIQTSQGMKLPNESYIPSLSLPANLPIITYSIPKLPIDQNQKDIKQESTDYPISLEFLKSLGCRTIHVPTSASNSRIESNNSSDDSQSLQVFIQNLLQQRKNMSENDLHALKNNPCIIGTTLESNGEIKHKCKPCDLHFPSVANRLEWNNLPIIDWLDINQCSQEYSFLKELGVKEVPDLQKLISRINYEHNHGSKAKEDYKLPNGLRFFAENFQQYYSKWWKNTNINIPFLPSSSPDTDSSIEVILTTPAIVYKEPGPLCPYLLPNVIRYFSQYFDIGLLGVKPRPSLSVAFDILMENRNQLLTVESAPLYFSYLNRLDGLNRAFIQRISTRAFIPLPGTSMHVKPSQVFIRSKGISTNGESSLDKNANVIDDTITRGLIDYIDYGSSANSFLLCIGVLSYPSAENLADLLIERQASYFAQTKDHSNAMISAKLRVYTNCLKQLAAVSNIAQHLNVEPLRSRLMNKPWCLAYQIIERSDGNKERIFKIAKPSDIYLDDDHQSAIDLRPLCAPDEAELTKLYELFGSRWLSESVKRTLVHKGKFLATERSKKLHDLIHHRMDMLFVNNRGERLIDIDEKRIELLKTKFYVYETEMIQCQLSFQNRTVTLNSTECSSCALEYEKNKVTLYIQKDISILDYIDIATELTRFVYKKPLDALVHSISDKLVSPLETLKRRGIPVDRLLKLTQQQQEQQQIVLKLQNEQKQQEQPCQKHEVQHINHKLEQHEQNDQVQRGFLQSLKDFLIPMRNTPSSISNNSDENISSLVEKNRINHFGQNKSSDEADIRAMIRTSRPYSATEFHQSEHSKNESINSCEFIPASTMIRYEHLLHGISLYVDHNVTLTDTMIEQGKQLAWLLSGIAKHVFNISVQTIHLFRDVDSARIAFNTNGALFFNLRYFEQVFADDLNSYLHSNSSSSAIVRTIVNFYYMVTCHELSHNIDSSHDLNFINRFERVSVRFMDAKDTFLSKFSFQ